MTDFQQRLSKAIERGEQTRDSKLREAAEKKFTEEEYRRLHNDLRLQVSDHIEACLSQLTDHFPGFQFETVYGDRGWGGACSRDDVGLGRGGRNEFYSRLEMVVRPFSDYHVLDLNAKGTIRNKEVFNRNHFQKLTDADPDSFQELVDLWVLEYAELYAAKS